MSSNSNMTHNGRKTWETIIKITNDPSISKPHCIVSANQVAHQLLINGRSTLLSKPKRHVIYTTTSMTYSFNQEYIRGVVLLKNNIATGKVLVLLHTNDCPQCSTHSRWKTESRTLWRQLKIIAILKPGEDSEIPNSYRPIALLCHTYELYERLILNRIVHTTEQQLIKKQSGFRPGSNAQTNF